VAARAQRHGPPSQPRQRCPGSRSCLLSDGYRSRCARTPLRGRRRRRGALPQRRRDATPAAGACDRFRLAHLSRLQPRHLRAARMQELRGPTITPGLKHTAPCPRRGLGEAKAGRLGQRGVRLDQAQPLTPRALPPHPWRQGPRRRGRTVAPPSPDRAAPLGGPVPACRRHRLHPPPLPLPWAMPCALQAAGELQGPAPGVTGLRGRRTGPRLCAWRDDLQGPRRPLPGGPPGPQRVPECAEPPPPGRQRCVTFWGCRPPLGRLLCLQGRGLAHPLAASHQGAVGPHRGHPRLRAGQASLDGRPPLFPPQMWGPCS
jgi:hypothetical protein